MTADIKPDLSPLVLQKLTHYDPDMEMEFIGVSLSIILDRAIDEAIKAPTWGEALVERFKRRGQKQPPVLQDAEQWEQGHCARAAILLIMRWRNITPTQMCLSEDEQADLNACLDPKVGGGEGFAKIINNPELPRYMRESAKLELKL